MTDYVHNGVAEIYKFIPSLFTAAECKMVEEYFFSLEPDKGSVGFPTEDGYVYQEATNLRRNTVYYQDNEDCPSWIFQRMKAGLSVTNEAYWKFDVTNFDEKIRMQVYDQWDHFGAWHSDVNYGSNASRKLTGVVILSDPSTYAGGDFQFAGYHDISEEIRHQGGLLVFPAYLRHRVTTVESGRRSVLLLRALGPSFR